MNGNHGTLNNFAFPPNAASGWNPGQTGVGLNFDGTDDYVDCGNDASLGIVDAITIGMWISRSQFLTEIPIGKNNSYQAPYFVNGAIKSRLWDSGGQFDTLTNETITDNEWHNIVVVYNSVGDFKTDIYLDGMECTYSVHEASTGDHKLVTNSNDLFIGKRYIGFYFKGSIDQVRIQTRAWSAKEAKDYAINPWSVYLDEEGN